MGVTPVVSNKFWPKGCFGPFGIISDYSWKELGFLFQMISENNTRLFIETGVNRGDLAAAMMAKAMFDAHFSYFGITGDLSLVDPKIEDFMLGVPTAHIACGVPCSEALLGRLKKFISNTQGTTIVFCNGKDIVRELHSYIEILRTGDIIVSMFPATYPLQEFTKHERADKIKRIVQPCLGTRFLAGKIL